jgi:hypothetical protein
MIAWRNEQQSFRSQAAVRLNYRKPHRQNVRFGSLADICSAKNHVRFAPESGHVQCKLGGPLWAKSGLIHCSKEHRYSIISSAAVNNLSEMVSPSALAALRLMISSYFVGTCMGRSAGFSPLRTRSIYPAARRNCSLRTSP